MNIVEFATIEGVPPNTLNSARGNISTFRFVEIKPYIRRSGCYVRRFNLQQYCPKIDSYCNMLVPGRWDADFASQNETPLSDDECVIKDKLLQHIGDSRKYIIACNEKHGTNYFCADDTETIGRVAIHILKERAERGYYPELELIEKDISKPTQKEEDFPNDPLFAKLAREQWGKYSRNMRQQQREKEFYVRFNKAMSDYAEAVQLLCERNNCCAYEGFRFEMLMSL